MAASSLRSTLLALLLVTAFATGPVPNANPSAIALPARASADSKRLEPLGRLGAFYTIAASGHYLYAASGIELTLFDVSDHTHLTRVGSTILRGFAYDIVVVDHYVYIAAGNAGLQILDISAPGVFKEVGSYPQMAESIPPTLDVRQVAVAGSYAYISSADRLLIVNIAQPSAPFLVGSYTTAGWIQDIAVAGEYVYLVPVGHLAIVSIANPSSPRQIGLYTSKIIAPVSLAVANGYAYLTNFGFEVVDLSNPTTPTTISVLEGLFGVITIAGNYAYTAGYYALRILDISDPAAPTLITEFPRAGYAIAVADGFAYMTDDGDLRMVDVTRPATPVETGSYAALNEPIAVALAGRYAYVADGIRGLHVVDVATPTAPTLVGRSPRPGFQSYYHDVAASGRYAYVAAGTVGLRVLDVANPAHPIEIDPALDLGNCTQVVVVGHYAYVDSEFGFWILDISRPTAPKIKGLAPIGYITDLAIAGKYAYAAAGAEGLLVVNIANPAAPEVVGTYNTPGTTWGMAVDGRYAYLADDAGLRIVDISKPASPTEAGFIATFGPATAVQVANNTAYVVGENVVRAIDVSDPSKPVLIGYHILPTQLIVSSNLAIGGDIIYITTGGSLSIIRDIGPSITGQVRDIYGSPFSGVTIHAGADSRISADDGYYSFTKLPAGDYTVTPTRAGYSFWPPNRTISLPQDLASIDFTILPSPIVAALTPHAAARLIYTDTQRLATILEFGPGAVSTTTTLTLTPTLALGGDGVGFAGIAFELAARNSDIALPDLKFGTPISVTITYGDAAIRTIGDERELALLALNDGRWQPATQTCAQAPPAIRDIQHNRLTTHLCRTGSFALFGPAHQAYLPLMWRAIP